MGNITKVQPDGETATSYTYGTQNQLLTETKGISKNTYTYDTYGNIRTIKESQTGIGTTASYTLNYDDSTWLDRLTSVSYTNATGDTTKKNLVYDEVGNPTTYYNGSKTLSMSWRYGRQLSNVGNGSSIYSYTYDVDGIRKSKTVNGTVHDYVTLDGKVVRETWGSTAVIDYFYDNEGKPYKIAVKYGNTTYEGYYLLNQQGDVIAIIDGDGDVLVEYTYNAWGKQTAYSTSGTEGSRLYTYNALKYRGYYYDSETGFYYLGSRYYDPVIGRFINADTTDVLSAEHQNFNQYNLYAYCFNNPVNMQDERGAWPSWATKAAVAVGAVLCVAAVTVLTCGVGTATLAGAVAVGAAKGALIGAAVGTVAGGGIGYATTGTLEGTLKGAAVGFGIGAAVGAAVGGTSAGIKFGTFSSKSSLTSHFNKHKNEFGNMYKNAREYAKDAKYVVKNGTYIPEKNAYIKFLGTNGKANYAYVGMKSGGRVSTYHVRSVSKLIKDGITLFGK